MVPIASLHGTKDLGLALSGLGHVYSVLVCNGFLGVYNGHYMLSKVILAPS